MTPRAKGWLFAIIVSLAFWTGLAVLMWGRG